jgi:hypothetical protein
MSGFGTYDKWKTTDPSDDAVPESGCHKCDGSVMDNTYLCRQCGQAEADDHADHLYHEQREKELLGEY